MFSRPASLLAVEGDHLRVGAPNPFSRDWLLQHHLESLQQAAREVIGGHPRISVVVDASLAAGAPPVQPLATPVDDPRVE